LLNIGDYTPQRSVFDKDLDRTHESEQGGPSSSTRWKYDGPWLAGKTPGEFERYVTREIRRRKPEFRAFVRQRFSAEKAAEQRRLALEEGRPIPSPEQAIEQAQVSEEELKAHITSLRHDSSALSELIHTFLDLPASPTPQASPALGTRDARGALRNLSSLFSPQDQKHDSSLYGLSGPPRTHPSAGLSYLRTAAHVTNHPVLGPQASHAPVQARILQAGRKYQRKGTRSSEPKLGVGGVVTDERSQLGVQRYAGSSDDVHALRPEVTGGGKTWVHPIRGTITATGTIDLQVVGAKRATISIHQHKLPQDDQNDDPEILSRPAPTSARMRSRRNNRPSAARSGGYGVEGLGSQSERPARGVLLAAEDKEETGRTYKELEDLLTQKR
jgi:hypothetical protein